MERLQKQSVIGERVWRPERVKGGRSQPPGVPRVSVLAITHHAVLPLTARALAIGTWMKAGSGDGPG